MRYIWLVIFALCCALSADAKSNSASNDDGRQSRPAQSQPKQSQPVQPIFPIAVQRDIQRIAGTLEKVSQKKESKNEQDRAERDVVAQEHIANWAIPMFVLGIIEILITGFGVWLVRRTILESRRATEDGIRPYVQISRCRFQRIPGNFRMIVTLSNSGQTPATFFEVYFRALSEDRDVKIRIDDDDMTMIKWNALGGMDKVTVGLKREDFNAVAEDVSGGNGSKVFYLVGKVRYGDIWGNSYETEFAYFTFNVAQTSRNPLDQRLLKKQYRKMSRAPGSLRTFVCIGKN